MDETWTKLGRISSRAAASGRPSLISATLGELSAQLATARAADDDIGANNLALVAAQLFHVGAIGPGTMASLLMVLVRHRGIVATKTTHVYSSSILYILYMTQFMCRPIDDAIHVSVVVFLCLYHCVQATNLSDTDVALLLVLIRSVGAALRKADPEAVVK